jgi:hypothetical protein
MKEIGKKSQETLYQKVFNVISARLHTSFRGSDIVTGVKNSVTFDTKSCCVFVNFKHVYLYFLRFSL